MFARGAQDAEQDDFNPFYYQHYFYYRQGYDRTRRRLRRSDPFVHTPVRRPFFLTLTLLGVLALAGFWVLNWQPRLSNDAISQSVSGVAAALPSASPALALPTAPPVTPTPPAPTPQPAPTIRVGSLVRVVNVGAAALRARRNPGLNQPVQVRFAEGSEVTILEGPVEADGYTWWRVQGQAGNGWSAERGPEGQIWLQPL